VLLSGGLDSTTILAVAKSEGFAVHALTFRYGQRHSAEIDAAKRIASRAGVRKHHIVDIDLTQFGGSALTADIAVPKDRDLTPSAAGAKEIPVTIGVFIDPGFKGANMPPERGWRPEPENRSFEYDTLSPAYSEFLLTEILPEVRKQYNVTDDPAGHAICGISSGGICAFTVAWERPDQFRKVVSHVGSFTNIRGGNKYPDLILASEPKPIRVFVQDGAQDNRGRKPGWNWVVGNLRLVAAFEEKNYDYKYVFGEGAHNGNHGGVIFPDTLRWLWRDYPK